ncbi:Uncharacterised protein [Mycobacteroides abscessus subsp. abscessus]|nr:Uncharacterised protein [Mycobacteroides abscessus subsp. abscessus]
MNRCASKSTRSILLTAATKCLMPNSFAMRAWRRVCRSTPARASTSRIATCALEAPVNMLRV